ncbi:hypothetical protein HYR69_04740 [Candidatus Sumerlaeota bacterium]|nr:hypothetical protein [Candidatus Sumerlaeota bacterium]MBI3736376.1 hypothetical protein [Candidatus Sumerlaeota bacterium]
MRAIIEDLLARVLSALAKFVTPALERQLAALATELVTDVPRVSGPWVIRFQWPRPMGGRPETIDATFKQFGREVRGTGQIRGRPAELYRYHARVKRNVLYGTYARKDRHVLAGTGSFTLKINPNSKQMSGYCAWYDSHIDDVWLSTYSWNRND